MEAIERYLAHFEKTVGDLRGKFILDVGAGYPLFAMECAEQGIAGVISLEKNFESFGLARNSTQTTELSLVIGRAEQLPFADETFELVIALFSLPILCRTEENVSRTIDELCRVAKPDGEIWLAPLERPDRPELNEWIRVRLTALGNNRNYLLREGSMRKEIAGIPGKSREFAYCRIKKS